MGEVIKSFKHVDICRHPLREAYMVVNKTFKHIPPYIGTLKQCERAARSADKKAQELLDKKMQDC